ncbi:MAG: hypothetical protein FJZ57_03445 [Chlamydiae bacterium]|nr:hypothetical protein [Chlamydiota bacterium]
MTLPIHLANTVPANFFVQSAQTIFHSLYSLFSSCVSSQQESREPVWKEVVVNKLDPYGRERMDRNQINNSRLANFVYVMHTPSGDLYNDDPLETVRTKCLLVALGSPVLATCRAFAGAVRTVVDTAVAAGRFFSSLSSNHSSQDRSQLQSRILQDWSTSMKDNLLKVVTAPFLLLGMEFGAIIGLLAPFEGRRIVATAESMYNNAVGAKNAHCFLDDLIDGNVNSENLMQKLARPNVFFLANCFQPQGNIHDKVGDSAKHIVIRESRVLSFSC